MPFSDEERDLLEFCIQAQVAQIAFCCKMTGSDSALMVDAVQKLEKIAEKVRKEGGDKWKRQRKSAKIAGRCFSLGRRRFFVRLASSGSRKPLGVDWD